MSVRPHACKTILVGDKRDCCLLTRSPVLRMYEICTAIIMVHEAAAVLFEEMNNSL